MDKNLTIRIENLKMWKSNSWVKYDTKICDAFLRLHFDVLFITTNSKVLESINLGSKLKGVFKHDYVILIISVVGNMIRKIKFQIKDNVELSLKELAKMFPLVTCNNTVSHCSIKFQSTEHILKGLLEKEVYLPPLPPSPALDHLVKLCILDPQFPQTVMQIQRAIEKETANNVQN